MKTKIPSLFRQFMPQREVISWAFHVWVGGWLDIACGVVKICLLGMYSTHWGLNYLLKRAFARTVPRGDK